MFTVEKVQFTKVAHETETSINLEARRECEDIMQKIYEENPSYWPYGLNIAAHDGGVYMIREASTRKPIGFTGWQERMDGDAKVGLYSIGILPEYRNNGYAKQAVAKLISIKAANVDRVQALVMKHNKPSLALAEALHVPVIKAGSVNVKQANKILKLLSGVIKNPSVIGGAGNAAFWDYLAHPDTQPWQKEYWQDMSRHRLGTAVLNALLGAGGGYGIGKGVAGLGKDPYAGAALASGAGTIALSPAKDLILNLLPFTSKVGPALDQISKPEKGFIESLSTSQKLLGGGLGAAGLLGGGYLGYKAIKAMRDMAQAQQQAGRGKVRVALPTKDPNDQETIIELPIDDLDVSRSQFEKLQRDLRRRIRKETKERTVQRPLSGFLEPKEAAAKKGSLQRVNYLLNILNA